NRVRGLQEAVLGGDEEERPILRERSSDRSARLALLVVQPATERVRRSQRLLAIVVEPLAVHLVRPRLGHYVDESGVSAPDFCIGAAANDLEFANRGLREE